MHGALVFFVSPDVRRYLPVVKFLAVLGIVFGSGMLVLDIMAGMPPSWIAGEGPFIIVLGSVMLWLSTIGGGWPMNASDAFEAGFQPFGFNFTV